VPFYAYADTAAAFFHRKRLMALERAASLFEQSILIIA
jgi:hypothetical protein